MGAKVKVRETIKMKILIIMLTLTGGFLVAASFQFNPSAHAKSADNYSAPGNFSKLAEMAGPAVVNIRTVKTIKGGGPGFRQF